MFTYQITYEYEEPRWNDTDRVKLKNSGKTCLRVTFYTTYSTGCENGPSLWEADYSPPELNLQCLRKNSS
jgi:hypothetical protein